MPQYILLLHADPQKFEGLKPDEAQEVKRRYVEWREGLRAHGIQPSGQKLHNLTGRVMKESAGRLMVTDGPYAETREVLGGYFAFEAESYEQVVHLAKDCPHLEFGSIEIREIEYTAAAAG